jgi:serine protease
MNAAQTNEKDHSLRIAIKLRRQGTKTPQELAGLEKFLKEAGVSDKLRMLPLIESLEPKQISELVDRAVRNDPKYEPADFSSWMQIVCPPSVNPEELAKVMTALNEVETAYVMRPGPPPINPTDDPRNANQGYLDAAPNGIDARFAWSVAGGNGTGIGFVDMEQGWNLNHEDLSAAGITIISGINNAYFFHGTSVLGEVLMVDNTLGGVGIAPFASGRVISQQRTAASYNTADAILDAAAHMAFGDVLLLEAQEFDPVGGAYLWPVEIVDGNYDAIRLTTALGIVVVEAGCNGGYDLDLYTNLSGKKIFDRSSADFRDSGAIMVGAGSSASPHTRLSFSNHGNRIDCYAWGENIDTTTTDSTGTDNTAYTAGFSGTSGASPIVVGAALLVQSIAEASLGYRFSPLELRGILTIDGTPSANPAADQIGVMPDLHAIITNSRINMASDLYLRDYVGDSGDPTSGIVSQSPDIIVQQAAVVDPQATFGVGSGTENDAGLSQEVDTGHDNFVYVRVLNRGGSAATGVSVDIYWSPPATLVTPNLWNLIGTASLASVPTGNVLTVSDAVVWLSGDLPAPGHYCFVGVAGNAQDPKPSATTFANFDQYVTYVENNNNIAWRNFNVIPGPPSTSSPPGFYKQIFMIPGAFDTSRTFDLEAIGRLPAKSRAFIEMPTWLADALKPHIVDVKYDTERGTVLIPLHPTGVQRLGTAILHAKSSAECVLLVEISDKERHAHYDFAIRQLYKEKEVGRLTWRFAALEKRGAAEAKYPEKQIVQIG